MGTTLGKYLMLGALLMGHSLQAQFTYTNNFDTITITGYNGPGGDITIPESISGAPVTSIAEGAFAGKTNINSITIPDSVSVIGARAFSGCTWLFGVVLPRRLTSIEDNTFYNCFQLTGITIPGSVTNIGAFAFYTCAGIRDLRIPDSVRSIGRHAFEWCWRLTNASMGNGVKSIADHAFAHTGLATLDLGRTVTIDDRAFSYCTNLLSVTIPATVTNLIRPFYYSHELRSVYFAGDAPHAYEPFLGNYKAILYFQPGTSGWGSTFAGRPALPWNPRMEMRGSGTLTITGYTNLPVVIEACTNLANPVWLPVGTKTLLEGRAFFSDSANLPARFYRLTPPATAPYDFEITNGTVTLTKYIGLGGSVRTPDAINGLPVTRIGYNTFGRRLDITDITIPDTVTDIGLLAFSGCVNLTNVTLSTNVTSIAGGFYDCRSLRSINIPAAVTNIDSATFQYCSQLTAINVDPANPVYSSAGGVVFDKSRDTLLVYPFGRDGSYTVPNTVTNIGARAFYSCSGLTNVTIPDSVTHIGDSAFHDCWGLTKIRLSGNTRRIGHYAFFNTPLTSVALPNSVAFLGGNAFAYCGYLTNVSIGNNLATIQAGTFKSCGSLTSINLPDSVTRIGETAFDECGALTNITFGRNLWSIADKAFVSCPQLKKVILPNTVTNISPTAFEYCTGLTAINVDAANPVYSSASGVLFNKSRTALLRCPPGKAGTYTISNGVVRIADYAFASCALTNVIIASSVTNIGNYAFHESQLTTARIPDGVTTVGAAAFFWSRDLATVIVGRGVTRIEDSAFGFCWSLWSVYFKGNAPSAGDLIFDGSPPTVYYLPSTAGWEAKFGDRWTEPWTP